VLSVLFPLFYRVLGALSDFPIPLDSGIFGLLDRQAVDSINSLREANRYLPGLRAWVGYRTAIVYYDRQDRVGGEGKLTFLSRIKYAMDAITSFSYKPLRVSFVLAGFASFLALATATVAVASNGPTRPLEFSVMAAIFLTGSLLLFCLGILGEYVGRVYDEVRGRPLSIINQVFRTRQSMMRSAERSQSDSVMERVFPAA
jgi:dolichol-phosphate mannosyltransferase